MLGSARNLRGAEKYPKQMALQAAICVANDPQNESSYAVEEMTQEDGLTRDQLAKIADSKRAAKVRREITARKKGAAGAVQSR